MYGDTRHVRNSRRLDMGTEVLSLRRLLIDNRHTMGGATTFGGSVYFCGTTQTTAADEKESFFFGTLN